jgi:hypothetical protein
MEISSVKGIFLRYILMPLIAIIMMVILGIIRRNKPAIKIKVIIIYVLLCSLCLAFRVFLGLPEIFLILTGILLPRLFILFLGLFTLIYYTNISKNILILWQ